VKVALLHPTYFPEVRRGSERIVRDVAVDLARRGHAPRIVTSHRGWSTKTVEDGVEVVRVPRLPEGRLRRRAFEPHVFGHALPAAAALADNDDLVHAFHITSALAATYLDKPLVLSIMGLPDRASLVATRQRLEVVERALDRADAVVVLSHAAAAACERWIGIEPRVIHPGVDLAAFTPDPAARAAQPTILCAADPHDPRKRVPLLLDAFRLVRAQRPDARLVVPPGVPPQPGVEPTTLDGGTGDPHRLAAHYRAAWVTALPSVDEAFGLVLTESLACGTPVVGTRSGAIPEIVDDDRIGRLFDGDDPRALAQALLDALDMDDAGEDCRARAEAFSTERAGAAHEALYRELIHHRH
jgi:glycosyltransferase involved in cell wall biosynthesis